MKAPLEFTDKCERPAFVSDSLSRAQAESLWLIDRGNLVTCAERHSALVQFYEGNVAK